MTWRVEWSKKAAKHLLSIERKQRLVIAAWVADSLDGCENPIALPNAKKLQGVENGWRWRVGAYRVLGTVDDGRVTIELFRVGHRRDVYRNL